MVRHCGATSDRNGGTYVLDTMIITEFTNGSGKRVKLRPHQRLITIDKKQTYQGHGALNVVNGVWEQAYTDINGSKNGAVFGLYCYFASNSDGYKAGFSPKDVSERLGMDEDSARAAFDRLSELGYITNDPMYTNAFTFHVSPMLGGEQREPVRTLDSLDAMQAVIVSDRHVKKALQYARTEKDFEAVDRLIDSKARDFFPTKDQEPKPEPAKQQEPEQDSKPIPFHVKMSTVLQANPDLKARYDSTHTPEEWTAVNAEIRAAILAKYGTI